MNDRPKLGVKANAPARDPRRRPVRGGAGPRSNGARPLSPDPAPARREGRNARPEPPAPARGEGRNARFEPPAAARVKGGNVGPEPLSPRGRGVGARGAGQDPGTRLSKVLSDRGLASRREADEWIEAGWVRVEGRPAVLGQRVRGDERIEIDPAARQQQARRVTVLLHKPLGYVSGQAEDGHEPAAVLVRPERRWAEDRGLPWHPGHGRGLAPAGRLDIDSTGLLVLTQDGRIARHLIGDESDVEKEYLVRVEPLGPGAFAADGLERLRHGLELDGHPLRPAKVSWANEDQLRFVLREGRKRQIRRMCELVGLKVLALKRVRIGSVVLGKLPPGQWRYLRDDERF
jgi:23S rRNA pseudouridine2604 synthase